jgi:ABC-type transport system substrate-binding protein
MIMTGLQLPGCRGKDAEKSLDVPGQKIRYSALGAKVRGLDPCDISDVTSSSIASQGYECLLQYHFLKRPYTLIPCLAESMPTISEDGLTYTIKIRKDVYFFDDPCFPNGKGRQLKADDFIYAWKRIADIKNLSKNWWMFEDRIVGLDDFRNYTKTVKKDEVDYSRPVEGLKALDDFTLQVRLTRPWPQFMYIMAHLPTAPMAHEAVNYYKDEIINHLVGTGPFMIKEWKRGQKIVFERNPKFREEYYPSEGEPGDKEKGYLKDAGKRLPLIDGIVFTVVQESQPLWLMFLQGKIDAAGIPKDFYNQAITNEHKLTPFLQKKGINLLIQQDPDTFWFGFNMEDPVVGKNLPLRRAMSCAWNREEYIDVFMNGRGIPANGMFPPMFEAYEKDYKNPWTEYNPELAKKLMREAEKIHGGKITVTLSLAGTDTSYRQLGKYFKRQMGKIGLAVKVDYMDWPTFQENIKTKSLQLFAIGWVADYPDEENFLQTFYGPNASPGANNFNYSNPEFNELFRKISVMQPSPERLEIYKKMNHIACNDVPAIFNYYPIAFVPYYEYLENIKPNNFAWGTAKYTNINLELRKKLVGR